MNDANERPQEFFPIIQGLSHILCKLENVVQNRAKNIWSGRAAKPASLFHTISRKRNACQGRRRLPPCISPLICRPVSAIQGYDLRKISPIEHR